MSELLHKPSDKAYLIFDLTTKLIEGKISRSEVVEIQDRLLDAIPMDFINAVDLLVQKEPVNAKLKTGINKMLNIFYTYLSDQGVPKFKNGSFLDQVVKDNAEVVQLMNSLKPLIKKVQIPEMQKDVLFNSIKNSIKKLADVDRHYQVMENVLFPLLEKQWPGSRCLQVLWSVHDDARKEIKELEIILNKKNWDLKIFNRLTGDLFFNLKTIIFREEKILIPAILNAGFSDATDDLLSEVNEIGWSFIENGDDRGIKNNPGFLKDQDLVNLGTGTLSPSMIELIFNHLPVDITFVDSTDTVQYFSTPKNRIFTRTNSVIGRKVQNCHPPESVHMVEEILKTFKSGEKNDAAFWIPFNNQFVLIQYFAIRDKLGEYQGTIEVTQDVAEIRELKGERRLLNWDDD